MPIAPKLVAALTLALALGACDRLKLPGAGDAPAKGDATPKDPSAKSGKGGKGDAPGGRVVPVATAAVLKKDVPIFLDGIGSVAAYKTVTVKPQVDGVLQLVLYREGETVRRGQVLAQLDPRPFEAALHSAQGALARDQAQLDNARLNAKRYQELVDKRLIAAQQATDQQALAGQLEGTLMLDKAQVESARLNLAYTRITSPIDGVTGVRVVDPGNVVHASDPNGLVVITQLDPIAVLFNIPQDELPNIAPAMQKAELKVEAWSRDGALKLGTGRLLLIDNEINQATGTLKLKAILPNPSKALWPNEFVKARLNVSTRSGALVIPSTAVQRGPDGLYAWVVGADSTVSARAITIERAIGELSLVAKGLAEGEQVVIDGQLQLRAGAKVQPRQSADKGAAPAQSGSGPSGQSTPHGEKEAREGAPLPRAP